jgi:OOP family OmpA-OmpF porin
MFKKISFCAVLAIASSAAMAADAPKFYAGADIGTTKLIAGSSAREPGFGAFAGYQFTQNIAIEAGVRRLANGRATFNDAAAKAHFDQFAVSAVGTLPLSHGFSAFGRLGVNRIRLGIKENAGNGSVKIGDTRALFGIGVAYSFSPAISARLELQKPMTDVANLNLVNLSAGVAYKF